MIGIFYIATGSYKQFFNDFLYSLKYMLPNEYKKLIVISDGLKEYDHTYISNVNIFVEDFIDYPYPSININKFQIIDHYAKKHNIDDIIYFDSETKIRDGFDDNFYNDLISLGRSKFVSLIPPYFVNYTFRDYMYVIDNHSLYGIPENFNDFEFFNDIIDTDYKWIRTSFFVCSKEILNELYLLIKDFITYNYRVMGLKLNYSDEFYVNYLNVYYPEKFHTDFYEYNNLDVDDREFTYKNAFFYQKQTMPKCKAKLKLGNCNSDFRMHILNDRNINSKQDINRFFIKHHNDFLLAAYGSTINDEMNHIFFKTIILDDYWFNGKNNIITVKDFYSDVFIKLYSDKQNMHIGFINKINSYTNNFDYTKFYEEDYDYIEGKSLDDISNMNFYNIDMCCFSKRYIEAYFNNQQITPKIYYNN
jgi:hypothetical protein